MIHITDTITINDDQINFKAVRSSGPGGQHVNKVSTAILLKYDVLTQNYPTWFLTQLKLNAGSQFSKNGVIILKAQSYRSQARNKDDALKRLIQLFKQSAVRPIKTYHGFETPYTCICISSSRTTLESNWVGVFRGSK